MKIYTKTGDGGETGLFGGPRVRKDDLRIEAFGAVDELNAALGQTRATDLPGEIDAVLAEVQADLFVMGAELATPEESQCRPPRIEQDRVVALEAVMDRHEAGLAPLKQFIIPGGTRSAAGLHVARSVCRRAERRVVQLLGSGSVRNSEHTLQYLNRLGDLLFVLARSANAAAGVADVPWQGAEAE